MPGRKTPYKGPLLWLITLVGIGAILLLTLLLLVGGLSEIAPGRR